MTTTILGALLIGGGVGILSGIFGVGGGFLITPLLNIVLGIPMPLAVGTSAVQILGVSTCSLYERRRGVNPALKMAIVMFGGNFVGARLGVDTLKYLTGLGAITVRGASVPIVELAVLLIFLPLLVGIAYWLYIETRSVADPLADRIGLFAKLPIPPLTDFAALDQPSLSIPVIVYFGLLLGFLTGLLGVGGGVLLLPALVYLIGLHTHCATATSLVMVWLTTFTAVINHTIAGNVDYFLAVPMLVGGTLGARLGTRLGARWSGRQVRRYFIYVVAAAIAIIVVKIGSIYI
ncbi:MAG: sulfite exporter TauE/SafE family protein [Anaerolineae bacterium]